jgi:hypothetical protein
MTFADLMNSNNSTNSNTATAIRLGDELSRYCYGRESNGAAMHIRFRPTKVQGVFIGALKKDDRCAILVDDNYPNIVYVYRNASPVSLTKMVNDGWTIEQIENATGWEGQGVTPKQAVEWWMAWR